jgi:hypothetical protein
MTCPARLVAVGSKLAWSAGVSVAYDRAPAKLRSAPNPTPRAGATRRVQNVDGSVRNLVHSERTAPVNLAAGGPAVLVGPLSRSAVVGEPVVGLGGGVLGGGIEVVGMAVVPSGRWRSSGCCLRLTALWEDLDDSWEPGDRNPHANVTHQGERRIPVNPAENRRRIHRELSEVGRRDLVPATTVRRNRRRR